MIVSLLIVSIVFIGRKYVDVNAILTFIEEQSNQWYAPILFITIYAVVATFGVSAAAFTLLSAPIFGFANGLLYTIIASNLCCLFSYVIARFMGKDWVLNKMRNISFLESVATKIEKNPFIFLMYMRLIPIFPFALVNYVSAMLGIKYKTYAIATLLGMLPGSIVYVYLGYSAANVQNNPIGLIVSLSILVLFSVIVALVQRKNQKRNVS